MPQRSGRAWFKPMRGAHRKRGRAGERVAAKHLKKKGYRILSRNVRSRHGEIDLIVIAPNGTLVAVEVKAGAVNPAFPPELHVTPAKQRKIVALTAGLARRHRLTGRRWRFDVIAVEFPEAGKPVVRHFEGAFQAHV
ncbi:MAG: YraN family protein [Planctomycetota bacterium]